MKAAIYARLSAKPDDLDNIPQQLKEGHATAERMGWTVVGEYVDAGKSAWREDVERPSFERLLTDASQGKLDVVIVRETPRLSRKKESIGDISRARFELCDWSGRIKSPLEWLLEIALGEQESEHKSIRGRAGEERRVDRGQAPRGGRRHYGYHSGRCCPGERCQAADAHRDARHVQGSPVTDNDGKAVTDASGLVMTDDCCDVGGCMPHAIWDDEAEIIRECADRWLGGETLTAIVNDLNTRGIPTSGGSTWRVQQLRRTLQSRRIAGTRVHKGREVRGNWEPIVDRDLHARLTAAERSKHQRPHEHYLLRGLIRCGRCASTASMQGSRHTNVSRRYRCPACSNGIAADPVDRLIWNAALGRTWHRDRASEELARTRLTEVKRQRTAAVTKRDELDRAYWDDDAVDRRTYNAQYGKLSQRVEDLDAERKQLDRQLEEASEFWISLQRMAEHYEDATWDERRAVLKRAIDRVVIEAHGEESPNYPVDSAGDPLTAPAHFNVKLDRVGVLWR